MSKKTAKILTLILVIVVSASLLMACANKSGGDVSVTPSVSQKVVTADDDDKDDKPSASASAKKRSFGMAIKTLTNPFFVDIKTAIEENLKEGDTLHVVDNNNDANKQMTDLEDLMTAGHDALFVTPCDYRGIIPSLQKAREKKIPVILVDSLCEDMSLPAGSAASDNFQGGKLCGEALAKDIGGKGKIAIFENTMSPPPRERVAGVEEVLKGYPDIQVVVRENGKGQVDTGQQAMENFLQAEPELVAVFSMNDPSAQGCVAAIEAAGKIGQIKVYGVDGSEKSKELIKEGKQTGTAAQFPMKMGEQAVKEAYKILDEIDGGKTLDEICKAGEHHIKIPCEYIDASNVDKYIGQK
nr:substrate-binding domain-containing protein [Maliibacterium massiliense]